MIRTNTSELRDCLNGRDESYTSPNIGLDLIDISWRELEGEM